MGDAPPPEDPRIAAVATLARALLNVTLIQVLGYMMAKHKLLPEAALPGAGAFIGLVSLPAIYFRAVATLDFGTVRVQVLVALLLGKLLLVALSSKLGAMTQVMPWSSSAQGACSREEPQPKFSPAIRMLAFAYSGLLSTKSGFGAPSASVFSSWNRPVERPVRVVVFRNCLGMIMSVSTFDIGFPFSRRGAAVPVSWVKAFMRLSYCRSCAMKSVGTPIVPSRTVKTVEPGFRPVRMSEMLNPAAARRA